MLFGVALVFFFGAASMCICAAAVDGYMLLVLSIRETACEEDFVCVIAL